MNSYKDYIFACDEHGNIGWPKGTKSSFSVDLQ